MIEGDSSAVDLAEARAASGNLCHQSRFTESHFPQALGEAVVAVDHANPAGGSSGELTERKESAA